mmetsp:Transcript_5089/g.19084  ORF Transcript_5089/g.19084 Transcript_5089/m.19084 type:complete len:101 (-) Transcript_5089:521-823(-)
MHYMRTDESGEFLNALLARGPKTLLLLYHTLLGMKSIWYIKNYHIGEPNQELQTSQSNPGNTQANSDHLQVILGEYSVKQIPNTFCGIRKRKAEQKVHSS